MPPTELLRSSSMSRTAAPAVPKPVPVGLQLGLAMDPPTKIQYRHMLFQSNQIANICSSQVDWLD